MTMISSNAFALGTFTEGGEPFAGIVLGDRVAPLAPHFDRTRGQAITIEDLLRQWDRSFDALRDLAARIARGDVPTTDLGSPGVGYAVPFRPGQILQAGANYRRHVVELMVAERTGWGDGVSEAEFRAQLAQLMDARARYGQPYIFVGLPSAMCGARDDVVLPPTGEQHDWELEVAVVIGRTARRVPRESAYDVVAGYMMVNDVTTRDLVYRPDLPGIGTDWMRAKNAPTFLPSGPLFVPAAFVADPMNLRIKLSLNGEVMQDESTADMIYDIPRLVEYTSSLVALEPGDLILTGSPAGNGAERKRFLQPGDVMEAEISGLGTQRNRCVAELPEAPGAARARAEVRS